MKKAYQFNTRKSKLEELIDFSLTVSEVGLRVLYGETGLKDPERGEHFITRRRILQELISGCKSGQQILVHIHDDFPQPIESYVVVYKDSKAANVLTSTDDFNIIVDIDSYMEFLKQEKDETTLL